MRVPEFKEITCGMAEAHSAMTVDSVVKMLSIYTGESEGDILKLPQNDIDLAKNKLAATLMLDIREHKKIIELNGIRYGFIPNWGDFTGGEYADITTYCENVELNISKIMSILYRPITKEIMGKYEIAKYEGSNQLMKDCPLIYFNGAMLFFWNIRKESLRTSLNYLAGKVAHSETNGDGTRPSADWQTTTLQKSKRLWNFLSRK